MNAVRMGTVPLHVCFIYFFPERSQKSQCHVFWNAFSFVKKTASLQASPLENIFSNKIKTNCLRIATRHSNREETLSL
jgi:hypothetical protein